MNIKKSEIKKSECRCNKCGKLAPIIKERSNENWICYDTSKNCECGGRFGTWINGKPLSAYK